jgi:hypothetical protein
VAQLEARLADAGLSRAVRFGLTRTLGQNKLHVRLEQRAEAEGAALRGAARGRGGDRH